MPPTATPFLPLWAVDPTDLTFSQLKKKFGGGKNQKVVKVRAGGSGQPLAGKRRGLLNSAFFLKIGSSGVVKLHQIRTKYGNWAQMRPNFPKSSFLVRAKGVEPPTFGTGNQRSIQLSYARIAFSIP